MQTTGFYIAGACTGENGEDVFLSYLEYKFPDYEISVGIPAENRRAAEALAAHGFTVVEASHDMRLIKADFQKLPASQ